MEVVDQDPLTGTDLLHWVIKLPVSEPTAVYPHSCTYVRVCMHVTCDLMVNRCNTQLCLVSSDLSECHSCSVFLLCPQFPLKSRDYVFVRRLQVKRNGSLIVLINRYVGSYVLAMNCELVPTDYLALLSGIVIQGC